MTYPIYKLHYGSYYKIISETEYVEVQTNNDLGGFSAGFFNVSNNYTRILNEGEDISEAEFLSAFARYQSAMRKAVYPTITVNQLLPKSENY